MSDRKELIDAPHTQGRMIVDGRVETPERQPRGVPEPEPIAALGESLASRNRDALFRRTLAGADCLAVTLALLTAVEVFPSLRLRAFTVAALPLTVLAAKLMGLYDRDQALLRKTTLEEIPKLFQLATLCSLALWLVHDLVTSGRFTRGPALLLWAMLTIMMPAARVLARAVSLRLTPAERCMVIGDQLTLRALDKRLGRGFATNAEIVAYFDAEQTGLASREVPGRDGPVRLVRRVRELDIDRVIVASRRADGAELIDLIRTLKASGIRVSLVPRMLEVLGNSFEFEDLQGITVMGVRCFRLSRSSALLKRMFDLAVAALLLVAMAPLIALIAVAIKAESPGPVLFRQVRVGRRGSRFHMLKFRTMVADAEALKPSLMGLNEAEPGLFKIANDPRFTRFGKLLRKACLDELPQLVNVLRGEMSLVGPRPLVCEEDGQISGWSRRRLDLTPGMTGHWQILGSSRIPLQEMVAIDWVYVTTWSLWTDVQILLRTIPHVLRFRGM
jgi:exopolysaccharide biosynthesis polyprenyl glycosylphosphotransferase